MKRVSGNFRTIVGVNSALIALSVIGLIPPALSGALHNATTIATSARSLRRYGPNERPSRGANAPASTQRAGPGAARP
jgi:cation transport ATPase